MKITVNGIAREVTAATLAAILEELGYGNERVATAVNEMFVPSENREAQALTEGDRIEILAPRQGG